MKTNAGHDFQAAQMGGTPGAAANYIALTENGDAPAAGDTALVGELTDTGLTRAQATYGHTAGTNTYTLTKQFTSAGGNPSRTVRKIGVFDAAAAGNMPFTTLVTPEATIAANDQLTITETVTM